MDVVLLRWPNEQDRRRVLLEEGTPRLLLLEPGADPPPPEDCVEDWVRLPAADADVRVRVEGLAARASLLGMGRPDLDDHGVLRASGRWVALPPIEARLAAALLARYEAVVSRSTLARVGWPQAAPGRNALDVHILRLRRRLARVGLSIRTVRARGYLMESDSSQQAARQA